MNALITKLTCGQIGIVKTIFQLCCIVFAFNSSFAQNVGIGVDLPSEKFEVLGNIKGTNLFTTGSIGIGTTTPLFKLHIIDGALGIYNSTSDATWTVTNSTTNGLNFLINNSYKLTVLNTGNVGIGNNVPNYKLDVNGNLHTGTNAVIDGTLTVNNGRGVLSNANGGAQLKYYTRTYTASTGNLAGFALGSEFSIGFSAAGFLNPPKVFVGDIVSTGGTAGELLRVQLVIYDVTNTSCHARQLNTSPNPVNYSTTWNIICIGD